MKLTSFIIMLFCTNIFFGQPTFIEHPFEPYFEKIQIAKFPDQLRNTGGYVFFISDSSYYNSHIKIKIEELIKKISPKIYLYKYKKNKFRYLNYNYSIGSTSYFESQDNTTFNDSTSIVIFADKHKKYWSWKHFKLKLKFISKDTIYNATIHSLNKLKQELKNSLIKLEITNSEIKITRSNQPYLNYTNQDASYNILYNFNDCSFEDKKILNKIIFSSPKIEISKGSKNIIFYFPLLL